MAYANSSAATVSIADRVSSALRFVKAAAQRRALYNRTVMELNALSDRDLTDLGLSRSDIPNLARKAATQN